MTQRLTKICFDDVENVIRRVLAVDSDVEITARTTFTELKAEPIDVIEIYFELGMDFSSYISGERMNEEGQRVLSNIADKYSSEHFRRLADCITTKEFVGTLKVEDLITIHNYKVDGRRN